jgi:hypothetical protein
MGEQTVESWQPARRWVLLGLTRNSEQLVADLRNSAASPAQTVRELAQALNEYLEWREREPILLEARAYAFI